MFPATKTVPDVSKGRSTQGRQPRRTGTRRQLDAVRFSDSGPARIRDRLAVSGPFLQCGDDRFLVGMDEQEHQVAGRGVVDGQL